MVEHSPQRLPNTIGIVIERMRAADEMDACTWYCENCDQEVYRAQFHCADIVNQLSSLLNTFFEDKEKCTCKHCGTVMQKPELKS
jgi:3-hydroxyanthranilate 3,4-dioxygenase